MRRVKNHTFGELLPERQRDILGEILGSEKVENEAWRKWEEEAWGQEEFDAYNELRQIVGLTELIIDG